MVRYFEISQKKILRRKNEIMLEQIYERKASIRKTHQASRFLRVYRGSPRERSLFGSTSSYEAPNKGRINVQVLNKVDFGDYSIAEVLPTGCNNDVISLEELETMASSNTKVLIFKHCSVMADQLFSDSYYIENHNVVNADILQVCNCGEFCIAIVKLR